MAKKLDQKALKEKKQKRMAAILLVVMLAVCAFSIPKTLKMINAQSAAATPPPAATTAPVDASAAPVPAAVDPAAAAAAAVAGAEGTPTLVVSSDVPAAAGGLVSFERLAAKDPFVQQVGAVKTGAAAAPAAPGEGSAPDDGGTPSFSGPGLSGETPPGPGAVSGGKTGAGSSPSATPPTPGATPAAGAAESPSAGAEGQSEVEVAQPQSAILTVNDGPQETISIDGTFPAADPVFQLVELLPSGAKIAIAGGDYENGAETITLKVGRPVTLMNTADGTRYEILLVSLR